MRTRFGRFLPIAFLLVGLLAAVLPAAAIAGPTLPMPPGPPIVFTGTVDFATQPYVDHFIFAEAGHVIAINLECTAAGGLDPMAALYQPDGTYFDLNSFFMSGNIIFNQGPCFSGFTALAVAPQTGIYAIRVTSMTYAANQTIIFSDPSGAYILKVYGASLPPNGFAPTDGRVNADPTPPVVMYCTAEGIDVYARNADNQYVFSVRALDADYEALGTPAANTLLATSADGNVRIYLLSSGEFQVNAYTSSEEYVAIWSGCPAAWAEHLGLRPRHRRTAGQGQRLRGRLPPGAAAARAGLPPDGILTSRTRQRVPRWPKNTGGAVSRPRCDSSQIPDCQPVNPARPAGWRRGHAQPPAPPPRRGPGRCRR